MMIKNTQKKVMVKQFHFLLWLITRIQEDKERLYELDLTGSRLSGKTISILVFCALMMHIKLNVRIVFVRYEPKGAKESWDEFLGVCELLGIPTTNFNGFNHTEKRWKLKHKEIRFIGFKSNVKTSTPKLGLARGIKRQVIVRIVDEITEFPYASNIEFIDQALGGAKQIVKINSSNPWTSSHWFINKVNKYHPYSTKKMKTKGYSIKSEWVSYNHFILSSQTNHRVNEYLTDLQHDQLTKLWDIDVFMAQVADLGIPGIVRGSIFGKMIYKIKDPLTLRFNNKQVIFEGGIDWGESDNPQGSGATLIVGRADVNNQWETADFEYFHRNSTSLITKTQETLIQEMVSRYRQGFYQYYNFDLVRYLGGLTIKVDSAAIGINNLFLSELKKQDPALAQITNIRLCIKFKRATRLRVRKYQMGSGQLYINKDECPNLFVEYQNAIYDEKKLPQEEVPVKDGDDGMDAMDYKSDTRTIAITQNKAFRLLYNGKHGGLNIWK